MLEEIANKFGLEINSDFKDTDDNLTHRFEAKGKRKLLNEDFENYFKSKHNKDILDRIDSLIDEESLKLYKSL